MTWMIRIAALVPIFLLAAGCTPANRSAPGCERDSDCAADEICDEGDCLQVECKRLSDCDDGQVCLNNRCLPEDTACQDDGDCEPGQICTDFTCVTDPGCRSDADCDAPTPICDLASGECVACVPDCTLKCCGDDGCGGECADDCADTGQQCDPNTCTCEGVCQPACTDRECGPDGCGDTCGPGCSDGETCNLAGQCGPGCQTGQRRCTADGYGFEACGPDPDDPDTNTYGPRIPCTLGDACDDDAGACDRLDCLETESLVILDRSSSMLSGGTWDWVTGAVLAKLGEREALNYLGYREFPYGGGCAVGPVVGMSKNNLLTIAASMTDPEMDSATPIAAALQGFVPQYGDPNDGQAAILISDGDETCDSQAEAMEAAGALWRSGVQVHVIAVTQTANKAFLDQLAQSGGTAQARLVTSGVELRSALEAIFAELDACRCAQGQTRCVDGQLETCTDDGLDFQLDRICPLGCNESGIACQDCLPGVDQCIDGDVYKCNPEGSDYVFDHACADGCLNDYVCVGEMVYIPAGSFVRGSTADQGETDEHPQRTISLDAYFIDATEVTTSQYSACVQAGRCTAPGDSSSLTRPAYYGTQIYADYPVIYVNWHQARDYCRWRGGRLPTEAEWERAARGPAPSTRTYPWGEQAPDCTMANFLDCSGDTAPVGNHPAGTSPEGVQDMAGNVYEWVHDWWGETYYESSPSYNPLGPPEAIVFGMRVDRGGSFEREAIYIRAANRAADDPGAGDHEMGFRCARTPAGGDYDQDGVSPNQGDCDDLAPDVYHGHSEVCDDAVDNDCDGQVDEDCGVQATYTNDDNIYIPDGDNGTGTWVYSPLSVPDAGTLLGVSVNVDIGHTSIGDLQVVLRHPDGSEVILHDHAGGADDNIHQTYSVTAFNGKPMNGNWQLRVIDTASGGTGSIRVFMLTLTYE